VQDVSQQQLSTAQAVEVGNRVTFERYNYFTPQPIRDAAVYMFRNIFHNNNDESAIKLLQALIPALENRTDEPRILINDIIVPEQAGRPGTEGGNEHVTMAEANTLRQMDLLMLLLFGGKERTEEHWKKLILQADLRLEIVTMRYHHRGAALVEIRLKPEYSVDVAS
jgi:hypothetical protein